MRVLAVLIAALFFAGFAKAGPDPYPCGKTGAHKITWVSYTYRQWDTTHTFVRTCHVPAHGKRRCSPWRLP